MKELIFKHYKILGALLILLIVLSYITYNFVAPGGLFSNLQGDLKAIQSNETITYKDLNGDVVDLRDFAGKPLIINSWASWMPFSSTELALLNKIEIEFKDRITILAMNRKEDPLIIRAYLETQAPLPELVLLFDSDDNFYKSIGGYAMPETVFYAADGTLIFHKRGVLTEDEIRSSIAEILSI